MNKTIQFRVSETLKSKIDAFAAQHELSTSEACRNLIAMQLERKERVITANKLLQILSSFGYVSISDIPNDKLDEVVEAYLESTKDER